MSLALAKPLLDAIADACRQHHVTPIEVFGSMPKARLLGWRKRHRPAGGDPVT
jgi:hypothetical protein